MWIAEFIALVLGICVIAVSLVNVFRAERLDDRMAWGLLLCCVASLVLIGVKWRFHLVTHECTPIEQSGTLHSEGDQGG